MTLAPYTGMVRGFTFGLDTSAHWEAPPAGLGLPVPDVIDQSLVGHGSFAPDDRVALRLVKVPLLLVEDSDEDVEDLFDDLKASWAPGPDTTLDLRLSRGERRYWGRCRGLDADLVDVHDGVVRGIVGHFDALDPWGYGPEVVVPSSVSPVTFQSSGTVLDPTRSRATLTVVADAADAEVVNLDDPAGSLHLTGLSVATTYIVDLHGWRVTAAGGNVDHLIRADSDWPQIVPGQNRFAYGGLSSLTVTYRSAYV